MNVLDDQLPSASQQEWIEAADLIRGHYLRLLRDPALPPDALTFIVQRIQEGRWYEIAARTYDQDLEIQEQRSPNYGCGH